MSLFREIQKAHKAIGEHILELRRQEGMQLPGGFKTERLVEMLEEKYGAQEMIPIERDMRENGAKSIGAGAATIASAGAAVGIGNVPSSSIHSVARNPSLAKQSFGYAILGFALTEAIALFALMMAFFILFVFRRIHEWLWIKAGRNLPSSGLSLYMPMSSPRICPAALIAIAQPSQTFSTLSTKSIRFSVFPAAFTSAALGASASTFASSAYAFVSVFALAYALATGTPATFPAAPVTTSRYTAIESAGSRSTDSTAIAADFVFATDAGDPATQSVMGSPAPRASVTLYAIGKSAASTGSSDPHHPLSKLVTCYQRSSSGLSACQKDQHRKRINPAQDRGSLPFHGKTKAEKSSIGSPVRVDRDCRGTAIDGLTTGSSDALSHNITYEEMDQLPDAKEMYLPVSKIMHWMDARALRRKDAFRGERPWGDTVCDPWISDRETSKERSLEPAGALTLTAYLLHDGSARKWEQRLKPLGVGAFQRWNLLVLPI
ncbi:hypothetical protein Scep_030969 [Stephania cephalantha]|uniref:ATP synthase subunit 9, mitochondrial n=1 Tax=Stephania cephalantha TaxID=152367 RepID=A0AAP0E1H4_9MAGN